MSELTGMYFHSFVTRGHKEMIKWQGIVGKSLGETYYLLHLYSWIDNQDLHVRIMTLKDMQHWHFYETKEEMNRAREDYECGRRDRHDAITISYYSDPSS